VSVGIATLTTSNQGVGTRVSMDSELELVFANDFDLGIKELQDIGNN
jgi:hypothetical protein